jgi:hypothetical protein
VVVLPILYMLSVGPAAWIHFNAIGGGTDWSLNTFETLYSPLIWFSRNVKWAGAAWTWYMAFWTVGH